MIKLNQSQLLCVVLVNSRVVMFLSLKKEKLFLQAIKSKRLWLIPENENAQLFDTQSKIEYFHNHLIHAYLN